MNLLRFAFVGDIEHEMRCVMYSIGNETIIYAHSLCVSLSLSCLISLQTSRVSRDFQYHILFFYLYFIFVVFIGNLCGVACANDLSHLKICFFEIFLIFIFI